MLESLVYRHPWAVELTRRAAPLPTDNDVTVKIRACGVCGTDLGIVTGAYNALPGVVLGHEAAGVVADIGKGSHPFRIGDRVVIDPTYSCGQCFYCRSNRSNHCEMKHTTEAGVTRDGCFADYYTTDPRFLRKLPHIVSFQAACLTEPLSCVLTGVRRFKMGPQLTAVVIGGGTIGLLYAMLVRQAGVEVCVAEPSSVRRELVTDISGDTIMVSTSLPEAVRQVSRRRPALVDLIVDTSGRLAGEALTYLASGGQLACIGLKRGFQQLDIGKVANESINIFGSIDSLGSSFDDALAMIERQQIPAERIVTDVMPLADYEAAFKRLGVDISSKTHEACAAAMKIILEPRG